MPPENIRKPPAGIYLYKVNNRNTRKSCEICSELTIKIPERRLWRVFINFEHISRLFLAFLLLTLINYMLTGKFVYELSKTILAKRLFESHKAIFFYAIFNVYVKIIS